MKQNKQHVIYISAWFTTKAHIRPTKCASTKKIASNHGCCSCQIIAPGEEALILYVHDPNVLFQPLLMKILKHIFRVLSAHTGPFQGLNMIATDCQNCINNFHFDLFDTIFYKKIYKSMAASLSLVTLVSPCQWMAATASILAKDNIT